MSGSPLSGKRVLIVEDEILIAMMTEDMLADIGCVIAASVATLADGVRSAESLAIDAAVLDLNLNGQRSAPIAAVLRQRDIPYLYLTGYQSPESWPVGDAILLTKPTTAPALEQALVKALARGTVTESARRE